MKNLHENQISVSVVFLGHSHAHLSTYCFLLIWVYNAGGEQLNQKPYGL